MASPAFELDLDAIGLATEGDPFSDDRILEATGASSMEKIVVLRLKIDTTESSLGDLGHRLPNVTELKGALLLVLTIAQLNNSNIFSTRDLGTGFKKVEVLWIARSGLVEMEGIGSFSSLTELYAAFNDISDLSPISSADTLEVIDLEGNAIDDFDQLEYLSNIISLHTITLEGNPIQDKKNYRLRVLRKLPQLEYLDDMPVSDDERREAQALSDEQEADDSDDEAEASGDERPNEGAAKALTGEDSSSGRPSTARRLSEQQMVNQGIKYARVDSDVLLGSFTSRPSTSAGAAMMSRRPGSAAGGRPSTARPTSSSLLRRGLTADEEEEEKDASSDLTFGTSEVFCGNPVVALRNRKVDAAVESAGNVGLDRRRPGTAGSLFTAGELDPDDILEQLRMLKIQRGGGDILDDDEHKFAEGEEIGGDGTEDRLVLESDDEGTFDRADSQELFDDASREKPTGRPSADHKRKEVKRPPRRPPLQRSSSGDIKSLQVPTSQEAPVPSLLHRERAGSSETLSPSKHRRRPLRPHVASSPSLEENGSRTPSQASSSPSPSLHVAARVPELATLTGSFGASHTIAAARPPLPGSQETVRKTRPRSRHSPKKSPSVESSSASDLLAAAVRKDGSGHDMGRWEEANRLEERHWEKEKEKERRELERRERREKRERRDRRKLEKEAQESSVNGLPQAFRRGAAHDHSEDVAADAKEYGVLRERMTAEVRRSESSSGIDSERYDKRADSRGYEGDRDSTRGRWGREREDEESSSVPAGSESLSGRLAGEDRFGGFFDEEEDMFGGASREKHGSTGALSSAEFSPWGNEEESGFDDLGKAYAPPLNALTSPKRDVPVGRIRPGMSSQIYQAATFSEEEE